MRWGATGASILGASLLLILLVLAVYGVVQYLSIARIGDLPVDAAASGEPVNYLIVGSDGREPGDGDPGGERSDVVMVARVDGHNGEFSVLSLPRDLVVPISGTDDEQRINSAYAIDRATLMETVREVFDIELHHYVEVDFDAFEELVDRVGGIPIWVDAALKDDASGLHIDELGCVVLDGEQALAFVRARQLQYMTETGGWSAPDPSADLGRTERQQVFMARAMNEAVSQARSDPTQLPGLVDTVVGAVAIDENLSVSDIMDLADTLQEAGTDELRTYSLPVLPADDGATLSLDEDAAQPVLDHFRATGDDTDTDEASENTGEDGDGGDTTPTGEGSDPAVAGGAAPEETSNLVTDEYVRGEPDAGAGC